MNRRFGFWKWLGLLGFSGLFLSVMLYVMVVALSRAVVLEFFFQMAPQTMLKGVSVLVIGVDQTARVTRSDSILVFHLDPDRKRIGVLSVPRDTRVPVKGHGLTKINHAYAFGGVNLLRETVSNLLSIPIDYYIKVDLKGVSKIIDVLGGLQVDVEKDLQYQDQAAGLEIDIKEGRQILDGEKAVQYLRFRQDRKGDIGRIERQQYFLQLLSEKMTQPASILRLPLLLKQTYDLVATDLGPKKMLNLAMQFNEAFRSGNIQKGTLPGAITLIDGVSYWRPNITGTDKLIQRVIFGFEKERELVVEKIETADPEASRENRRKIGRAHV